MRITLLAALLVLAPAVAAAAAAPDSVTASADFQGGTIPELILTGHVKVNAGDVLLTADKGTYNIQTLIAILEGHIVLTRAGQRMLAGKLEYNFGDGTFKATDVRIGTYPYYVAGASATGTKTEMTIDDATATLGEPGRFAPVTKARQIIVSNDHTLRVVGASVGVGSAVPIKLPQFQRGFHDPLLSLLSFTTGFRSSLGASVDVGLHLPVAPGISLGGDLGIYTARGVMFGPSGEYSSADGSDVMEGDFRSGFINDHGDKKLDILGRPVPENRAYFELNHRQQIGERLTFSGAYNYWKDSEILRDFRPNEFNRVQQPDTFASEVYTAPNFLVSLFARFQPNHYHEVQERLPELTFDLLPTDIGHGLLEQFHAGAVRLREDPPLGGPTLRSTRLDSTYELSRPMAAGDWFAFTPVVGGRVTHYTDTVGAAVPGGFTRTLAEAGFDARLRASGTFAARSEIWKIDGLRHLVTPTLGYRTIFHGNRGRAAIPRIDRDAFDTYLPPLGLGSQRAIDDMHSTDVLRIGIDNTLQTRDPEYGSRDLVVFNNAVDFRFHREPGERAASEVHSELLLTPAPWLRFNLYESFAPQSGKIRQLNTGLSLIDGEVWSLRFNNNFLRNDTEVYSIEGTRRLNETYEVNARFSYDARNRRFNEQAFALRQHLANTWLVEYAVTLYDGPRRESDWGLNLRVRMLSF